MATKRKAGGGRKPVVLPNPFVIHDVWGDEDNILWGTEDELDIRIEDILVGCVRSLNVTTNSSRGAVDWTKLLRVYRNVWQLESKSIQDYLMCSERTATRYMQAIKLANPFLIRYMAGDIGSDVYGYITVTPKQVENGYLLYCTKSKEGHIKGDTKCQMLKEREEPVLSVQQKLESLLHVAQ